MKKIKYWVYRTKSYVYEKTIVQAQLIDPDSHSLSSDYSNKGFRSPRQNEPYSFDLKVVYKVRKNWLQPDNYAESYGFNLYSKRLVDLINEFGVKNETFPAKMVDEDGTGLKGLNYFVFHSLEGVQNAMDEQKSGWTGDWHVGIPTLILDYNQFEHRPIILVDKIYVPLMRDDLKKEIERREITGFGFLSPERYKSGSYGFPPDFED